MFGLFSSAANATPNGMIELANISQLKSIIEASETKPQLLFKHSTRCSISSMALNRMTKGIAKLEKYDVHYLDLIAHRDISNAIAQQTGVEHQSPQTIIISKGKAIYAASHHEIDPAEMQAISI